MTPRYVLKTERGAIVTNDACTVPALHVKLQEAGVSFRL